MAKGKKLNKKIPAGQKQRKKISSPKIPVAAAYSYANSGDMPMGSPDVRRDS